MDQCRVCGNQARNAEHIAREMMFGLREEFRYLECGRCGCVQIATLPENMARYYPDTYYSKRTKLPECAGGVRALGRRLGAAIRLRWAGPWKPRGNYSQVYEWLRTTRTTFTSAILDVGCGRGKLLHQLRQVGFRNLVGVDPFIDADLHYDNGITIFKGSLADIDGTFDLVMMHHSFEHMEDPCTALHSARRLLRPDGYLLIRIPLADSFAWRNYGVHWFQLDAPRHFFLHSRRSIAILAERTGFEVVKVRWDSNASQFWGSEQYLRDIPHHGEQSYKENRANSIFDAKQIRDWERKAQDLNRRGEGDQACFYLRRQDLGDS